MESTKIIVQILTHGDWLVALCGDGSVWRRRVDSELYPWVKYPTIEEPKEAEASIG